MQVKNDMVESDKKDDEKADKKEDENTEDKDVVEKTVIDIDGFESRVEMLDIPSGNLGRLTAVENKLLFTRFPNSGSPSDAKPSLDYYDFDERVVKTIVSVVAY